MSGVLIRRYVKMHREDSNVKMGAEVGVMLPQARKIRSPWTLGEARKKSSLEPSEGAWPCKHIDLGLTASRTERG